MLGNTAALVQKKKGGPYTKEQKRRRQEEVYKLYFEYSYSARKILDIMKINRNTINLDITKCYESMLAKIGRL